MSTYGPVLGLTLLTLALYGRGLTHSRGAAGDSFFHVVNGIFIYDAARDPLTALSDPLRYATEYYRHYPAVSLGYYPPVFAILEALLMSVLGVSPVTGQLTVLLMAVALALLTYAWLRLRFERWWACATAAAVVSTPLLVYWGRDIMLEIPALAFMVGAMWGFERVIRSDRPSWCATLLWALFTTLAFWTKQHTILLLGVFAVSLLAAGRWRHFRSPQVLLAALIIALAAAGITAMTLHLGGIAISHTLGASKQHVVDRFNVPQWTYYLRALPQMVSWPSLALAVLALMWLAVRRERYGAPLLAWIVVFYVMHSYFKAQTVRYACLWVPPFCVLASIGLKHIPKRLAFRVPWGSRKRFVPIGAVGLVVWTGVSIAWGATVRTPRVPTAYQRAAEDLCDRLAPFTCMTFFPDRPGRLAVCFRLAVEERRDRRRDIDAFGRIVRAVQVLRNWDQHWPDLEALSADLRRWNVKYLLTEVPRPINPRAGEDKIAEAVDGILARGEFRRIRTYPVRLARNTLAQRTMSLYERIEPMVYHPHADPPLHLARIPVVLTAPASNPSP